MRFIGKKEIKFVKLLLISPYFDQTIHFFYIFCLGFLFIRFLNVPNVFSTHEIENQIRKTYEEDNLRKIQTLEGFKKYLNSTMYKLYDFSSFPKFIPMGGIRLQKYSIKNECYSVSTDCVDVKSSKAYYLINIYYILDFCSKDYLAKSNDNKTVLCTQMYNSDIKSNQKLDSSLSSKPHEYTFYDIVQIIKINIVCFTFRRKIL